MTTATLPAPTETLFSAGRLGACVGAVALVSMLAFEAMAVAAAMPAIAAALDGVSLYALAFGGMLATSVLGMVIAGRWCDRQGAGPATALGLVVFTAGLLMSGLAGHMGWLVAGRIVQGLGAGMLGVTLYVGMGQLVPPALHPRMFALFAAAWVLPGLCGPLAAATLVSQWGWRSVFLGVATVVPLAAMLLLPAINRLPRPQPAEGEAANSAAPIGWALLAAAGALLLHAAGQSSGSALGLLPLVLGLVAAAAAARQLLPRGSLLAAPGLPAVVALRGLLAAAFASVEVFLPLHLTRDVGWSLLHTGLVLSTGAVAWSLGSALQARLVTAQHRQRGLQLGFAVVALGLTLVAAQPLLGWPAIVAGWALAGLGIGMAFPMLSVLTLALSPPAEQGRNASALQIGDALCCSATLAVAGALFNAFSGAGPLGWLLVLLLAISLVAGGALLSRRTAA